LHALHIGLFVGDPISGVLLHRVVESSLSSPDSARQVLILPAPPLPGPAPTAAALFSTGGRRLRQVGTRRRSPSSFCIAPPQASSRARDPDWDFLHASGPGDFLHATGPTRNWASTCRQVEYFLHVGSGVLLLHVGSNLEICTGSSTQFFLFDLFILILLVAASHVVTRLKKEKKRKEK
jgi:hypothetical protein